VREAIRLLSQENIELSSPRGPASSSATAWNRAAAANETARWKTALLLGLLFAGALCLRVVALGYGLPYVEHTDEPAIVETVVRMVRNGDPNPHSFLYPSLCLYLWAAATRLHLWWGLHHGIYAVPDDLPLKTYLYTTSSSLYVWNRAVTAFLGAATVPALYLLGKRMFDARVGLLGALMLMIASFHVVHSHYITTDAPTGLWVVLALIGAWRVARSGAWSGYVIGGIGAGLAAGTKYNAGVVALALVVAHALHWRTRSLGKPFMLLVAGGALSLATFLVTTPYALLDWPHFVAGLRFNAAHYASGSHGDFVGRWQVGEYARFLWSDGLMAPGSLLLLVGLPLLAWRWPRQTLALVVVIGAEMALLMMQAVNFVRNVLPVLPLIILLAGAGAIALADAIPRRRWRPVATVGLGIALLAPQARQTQWDLAYWRRPHTMVVAADDLRRLPRGLRAAVEQHSVAWANDPVVFPVRFLGEHPIEWYRENGFRYLLVNNDFHSPNDKPLYAQMQAQARVVTQYPERRLGLQSGPGGAILDLGEHVELMRFARRELRFADAAALLGFELQAGAPRAQITPLFGADAHELHSGESLQINMYWRALAKMDRDYTLFVHVLDEHDNKVAQRDLPLRYSDYPSSHWQPGELVVDRADLALPALPPGVYRLAIGLYDAGTGARLPLAGGQTEAQSPPILTTVTVR
jgi:hypothetical protein